MPSTAAGVFYDHHRASSRWLLNSGGQQQANGHGSVGKTTFPLNGAGDTARALQFVCLAVSVILCAYYLVRARTAAASTAAARAASPCCASPPLTAPPPRARSFSASSAAGRARARRR